MILRFYANDDDPWVPILIQRVRECSDYYKGLRIIAGNQSFHKYAVLPSKSYARNVYAYILSDSSLDVYWVAKLRSGNTIAKSVRLKVYRQSGNRCLKCKTRENLTIDHVIPLSKGGTYNISNLQCLCQACNLDKGEEIVDYRPNTTTQTPSQTPPQVPQESSPQQCE